MNNNNDEIMMFNGKPLQLGSFDEYHFCMPDKRYFDVAEILVIELSFACVVIKNVGMRGEDKKYKLIDGEMVPISELEFIRTGVSQCDLSMPVPARFTGKNIIFDARERERMLFGRLGM